MLDITPGCNIIMQSLTCGDYYLVQKRCIFNLFIRLGGRTIMTSDQLFMLPKNFGRALVATFSVRPKLVCIITLVRNDVARTRSITLLHNLMETF